MKKRESFFDDFEGSNKKFKQKHVKIKKIKKEKYSKNSTFYD